MGIELAEEPTDGTFEILQDQWAYLERWFAFLGPWIGPQERINPFRSRAAAFHELQIKSRWNLDIGTFLPLERFLRRHEFDNLERLLLLALVRDTLDMSPPGGATFRELCGAAGAAPLESQDAVRKKLEVSSSLRRMGLIECNLDPNLGRRRYRLAPRYVPLLLEGRRERGAEVPRDYEGALDLLCADARSLLDRLAWDPDGPERHWSGPARRREGWDRNGSGRTRLARHLSQLVRRGDTPLGKEIRKAGLSPTERAILVLLVRDARMAAGSSTLGLLLSAAAGFDPGPLLPVDLFGPDSRLAKAGLIDFTPGPTGYAGRIALSERAGYRLLPGTCRQEKPTARESEELPAPFETIEPKVRLSDVVLPPDLRARLGEALASVDSRELIFETWGFEAVAGAGGVALLFEGLPGTGKTLTAEAVAGELERPLHRVLFDKLQNKWLGETEKQIAALFREAEDAGAILLLDEADALLGARDGALQRFEVRHTNLFLQEIERFSGVAILTTNRAEALDPALERRLAARLQFPLPGPAEREALWRRHLPPAAPLSPGIDLAALARMYPLSGSQIRTACLAAASAAALREEAARTIQQADLEAAAARIVPKVTTKKPFGFRAPPERRAIPRRAVAVCRAPADPDEPDEVEPGRLAEIRASLPPPHAEGP